MHLDDFKLERFFAKYEFSAPYILCSSDPQSLTIEELLALEENSLEGLKKHYLGYTETKGSPKLREEISKLYENIYDNEILVHSGGEEGIFLFMNCALSKGDHIIALFPAYQSLYSIAENIGCEVTYWKLKENENNVFELDINFLKYSIKENTKAIIVNFPHNPTGYLPSLEIFKEIIKIASENNILLFCDEVYRFLEHNKKDTLPSACDLYDFAISTGSMSKAFGLPGLRIGWSTSRNQALLNKMWSYKDFTTICSSAPSEYLATLAIRNREKIFKKNLSLIEDNLKVLKDFFNSHKDLFSFSPPKATTIAFPRLLKNINSEEFCVNLVEKQGVFLLPSTKYDFGNKNFRVGFGRKSMKECLNQLEIYLKTLLVK